jgi:hypothetical protein
VTFHSLIERIGMMFKPPILKEEDVSKDIDCMDLIKDVLPELNVENVEKIASVLGKDSGFVVIDSKIGTIMRKFHRIRYKI